jgi:hypothetical protein
MTKYGICQENKPSLMGVHSLSLRSKNIIGNQFDQMALENGVAVALGVNNWRYKGRDPNPQFVRR